MVDILTRMVVGMDHRPVTSYGVEIGSGKVLRHQIHTFDNSQRKVLKLGVRIRIY